MKSKSKTFANILVFLAALLFFSFLPGRAALTVNFDDDALLLSAPNDFSLSVAYAQIDTLELVEQFDPGTAVSGEENRRYRWGEWENNTWGRYTLCAFKKVDPVILLTTLDGETVVFNYESEEATRSMHQMFTDLLAHYESETT